MGLRKERLTDEIMTLIGECFQGGQMSDPRVDGVTVTAVKLSDDLQIATVYFRLWSGGDPDRARSGLESAAGFLRNKLAKALKIRRVPELRFFYDESIERASRIEDLLTKI